MNAKYTLEHLAGSTRRQIITGAVSAVAGMAFSSIVARADSPEEISHTAESIHQAPVFKASRQRIYEALTDAAQFHKVTMRSKAISSGMVPATKPTEISRDAGGAFTLFGGYVTGRHIELAPNERIVQAWRAGSWETGIYSIARFELKEQAGGTRIIFDHTGFPVGTAQHLADGWKTNYWEPLAAYLAS